MKEDKVFKKIMLPTAGLLIVLCVLPDFYWKVPVCLFFLLTGVLMSVFLSWYEPKAAEVRVKAQEKQQQRSRR
ncbi:hypothetical protein [Enterococcus sp. AD013-P3]|uniref:hypothetical protein n=1 Tax=Enterococcus sp. AD013-P3 TaxID=3411036 RepID=UPI003B92C9B1